MKCDRCHEDTSCWKTSWFNSDKICPRCNEIEKKNPRYKRAHDKVIEEEKNGNLNYKGIGWKYYCADCEYYFERPWYSITVRLKNGEEFKHDGLVASFDLDGIIDEYKHEYKFSLESIDIGLFCPECLESIE